MRALPRPLARLLGRGASDVDGRRGLGVRGEREAARLLRRKGHRVLARNVRAPGGEVDLITLAPDRRTVVFVEVKARETREGRAGLDPEAGVTPAKGARLVRLAQMIAAREGWRDRPLRIDVVAIECLPGGEPVVRHYEDAVRPG